MTRREGSRFHISRRVLLISNSQAILSGGRFEGRGRAGATILRRSLRVGLIFPVLLFVVIRQIYCNLLGVGRDTASALLVCALSLFAMAAFQLRLREVRLDLHLVDAITLAQFLLASCAIYGYFSASYIALSEAVFSVYYYCLSPFLIYAGFALCRLRRETQQALRVSFGLVYAVTLAIGFCELVDIKYWLFEPDRVLLQRNEAGFLRATGLYGSQIDYGFLSFFVFGAAFYFNASRQRRHGYATLVAIMSVIGVLLSMSRVWIAALLLVPLVHIWQTRSPQYKIKAAAAMVVFAAILYPVAMQLGVVDMFLSNDSYAQASNTTRLRYLQKAPRWLLEEYSLVGTGPGTQNGPAAHRKKVASDFLWLAYMIDFGSLLGIALLFLKVVLIVHVLARGFRNRHGDRAVAPLAVVLCTGFLLASFVNSAYAHVVSISLFYVVAGLCLYHDTQPSAGGKRLDGTLRQRTDVC